MKSSDTARAALMANPFPPSPFIEIGDDSIIIKCGFSEQLLQLLRWIPNVQWRPEKRYWTVPIRSAESVRPVLPEILRLSEATQDRKGKNAATDTGPGGPLSQAESAAALSSPELFKAAARFLFGTDWQRDTARALQRDETALARWLVGDTDLEDGEKLFADMAALMRQRAEEIAKAADHFSQAIKDRTF